MSESKKDTADLGEVQGVQKLVFDYLESLLSDPDAGIDTEAEIAAINEQMAAEASDDEIKTDESAENIVARADENDNLVEPEPEP
ncbi:hypothetical protein, partial [Neptuniibacter sp. UBA847]